MLILTPPGTSTISASALAYRACSVVGLNGTFATKTAIWSLPRQAFYRIRQFSPQAFIARAPGGCSVFCRLIKPKVVRRLNTTVDAGRSAPRALSLARHGLARNRRSAACTIGMLGSHACEPSTEIGCITMPSATSGASAYCTVSSDDFEPRNDKLGSRCRQPQRDRVFVLHVKTMCFSAGSGGRLALKARARRISPCIEAGNRPYGFDGPGPYWLSGSMS